MSTNQLFSASDFRNRFAQQVKNPVLKDARTSDNPPANWGNPGTAFYSSSEINSQLDGVSVPKGENLSAAQVYNTVMSVAQKLGNVRKYKIERFYNNNGNWQLTSSEEGKGAFRSNSQTFPTVANPFKQGQPAKLSDVTNFFSTIYNQWSKLYNNQVYYRYEYCHSNCHSNCHGSGRGRR